MSGSYLLFHILFFKGTNKSYLEQSVKAKARKGESFSVLEITKYIKWLNHKSVEELRNSTAEKKPMY